MTHCVAYTRGPDTTLTVDLKVKFIGFLTCLRVRPVTSVCFDIGVSYAHESITMRRCVAYITLTLDLRVKFIGFWHVFVRAIGFLFFDIVILYFAHERIPMRWCIIHFHKKHWCTHQSYGPKKFPREHYCFHKQKVTFFQVSKDHEQ